jgi:hypothetical protein
VLPTRHGRPPQRPRRTALLAAIGLLAATVVVGFALGLLSFGDDTAPRTAGPAAAATTTSRSYPFPVFSLTRRAAAPSAATPTVTAATTPPPGSSLGAALGRAAVSGLDGDAPGDGSEPTAGARPTTSASPRARPGRFPPPPPAPFPVPAG